MPDPGALQQRLDRDGIDSIPQKLWYSRRRASQASAASRWPARDRSHRRRYADGKALDATETRPSAPASIACAALPSSPLSIAKVALRSVTSAATRSDSLRASLMPTMFG